MFQVSFWCVHFLVSIPKIKWSCFPDVFPHYVCEGAWFTLNFHVVLKTSFVGTRVLFRVLCLGVSVSMFSLCIKLTETVLQLVVLVAAVTVGPGCVRLVCSAVLIIEFLRAWIVLHISIGCVGLFITVGTISRIGRYCYR